MKNGLIDHSNLLGFSFTCHTYAFNYKYDILRISVTNLSSDNIDNISEADETTSFLSLASTHSQPSNKIVKAGSDVWDYIQKITDENNVLKSYKCKFYNITFSFSCATSTLRRYL